MIKLSAKFDGIAPMASAISQIPSLIEQGAIRATTQGLELISKTMRERFLSGPYPENVEARSGHLRATWKRGHADNVFTVVTQGPLITGTLGSKAVQARILNEGSAYLPGGVIRPTHGQYLAIPTALAKSGSGVVKAEYRKPLRQIPNLYLARTRSGKLYAAERISGRRSSRLQRILFWLVRSVTIKGRFYIDKSVNTSRAEVIGLFQVMITTIVDRTNQTIGKARGGR
jgi:hypothetical protein